MEWIITDPDTNQMYKRLNDDTYLFREDRIIDPITGETETFELEMSLDNYDWWEIIEACKTFGYSAEQVDKWLAEREELELILECLFELEN